jgi:hypothetical protein
MDSKSPAHTTIEGTPAPQPQRARSINWDLNPGVTNGRGHDDTRRDTRRMTGTSLTASRGLRPLAWAKLEMCTIAAGRRAHVHDRRRAHARKRKRRAACASTQPTAQRHTHTQCRTTHTTRFLAPPELPRLPVVPSLALQLASLPLPLLHTSHMTTTMRWQKCKYKIVSAQFAIVHKHKSSNTSHGSRATPSHLPSRENQTRANAETKTTKASYSADYQACIRPKTLYESRRRDWRPSVQRLALCAMPLNSQREFALPPPTSCATSPPPRPADRADRACLSLRWMSCGASPSSPPHARRCSLLASPAYLASPAQPAMLLAANLAPSRTGEQAAAHVRRITPRRPHAARAWCSPAQPPPPSSPKPAQLSSTRSSKQTPSLVPPLALAHGPRPKERAQSSSDSYSSYSSLPPTMSVAKA